MKTLNERIRAVVGFDSVKHELNGYPGRDIDDIVDELLDDMPNSEFLRYISVAMEEMFDEPTPGS